MGQEVGELETALSARLEGVHAISCSSGTDALILALLGLRVRPGDRDYWQALPPLRLSLC